MRFSLPIFGLCLLAASSSHGQSPDPDITLPRHAHMVLQAEGRGVQIYTCSRPAGVAYEWSLTAPEARLFDAAGEEVGSHSAGPTWTWKDGSSITGKVLQRRISQDALSVPWLLLAATHVPGKPGALSTVSFVRRSDTKGGISPADGCDPDHAGATVRVPYTATYTFYAAEKADQ